MLLSFAGCSSAPDSQPSQNAGNSAGRNAVNAGTADIGTDTDTGDDVTRSGSYDSVELLDLLRAYKDNEIAADLEYKGKTAAISGYVSVIGNGGTPRVNLSLSGDDQLTYSIYGFVECFFDESDTEALSRLSVGDCVSLVGTIKGGDYTVGIDVENCFFQ